MNEYAVVHDVRQVFAGSYVVAASGVVVSVTDASDFSETGGSVVVNGNTYTYVSADLDADTITLSAAQTLEAGTFVEVAPQQVTKVAVCIVDEGSDALSVRVPHALFDRLPEGIRDADARETVRIGLEGTALVILDVLGKEAAVDGAYLNPGTVGLEALGEDVTARDLGGSKVFYQPTMPAGAAGDTWYDTDDGNKVYVHNGTTFVSAQDAGIGANEQAVEQAAEAAAQAAAAALIAQDAADAAAGLASRGKVFVQSTPPATEFSAENRVTDPLMQTAGYWFSSGQSTFPRSVVTTAEGKIASRITRTTTSACALYSARGASFESPITAAKGGEVVTITFGVMANADTTLVSQVGYGNATASLTAVSEDVVLTANVPRIIKRTFTIPPTGQHINQQLYLKFYSASGAVGDWFQIWEPGWFAGTYEGDFFSGDTQDNDSFVYGWAGQANNSFSRRFVNNSILWIDTTDNKNTPKRFNGMSWEAVTDAAAIEAKTAADAAQATADTINNSTLPAFSQFMQGQLGNLGQEIGLRNSNFTQSTTPTALRAGDTWIDTGNGNILKVATAPGTANWVSRQDVAISLAQQAASGAQTSADGKTKITYSTSAPVNGTSLGAVGDTWFVRNVSTGVVSAHYEATAANTWGIKTLSNTVIAALDAGKITTGTLSADRIAANALSIGKVNGLQSALDAKATPAQVEAAKQQAITDATAAAATDAQTKANEAKAAAEAAAKTYADTVASGAEADAIAAAATDAQSKADAAQAAAVAAAAADATAKANQAKTDALNEAIADASQKYDYARARVTDWTYPNSTEIDGAFLRTGTVAANQIIVGNGNNTPLSTEVASKATPAQVATAKSEALTAASTDATTKASNAQSAAITTAGTNATTTYGPIKTLVEGWKYTGQTTINGGVIQTDTVTAGQIAADAITGKHSVTGATVQTTATAARGLKLTSTGLLAYNASGTATLSINASTGAISMLGALTSGSTVTGATVTGGTIQSEATAARGVKITSAGLTAYDSAGASTFAITGSTGAVTMKGALTSGSTITGATVTGGLIQTTNTVARGIEMTTTGLKAYDASGSPTFVIDAATGTVGMKGSLTSGSTISGATITGSDFSTVYSSGNPYITINQNGMNAWKADGTAGFILTTEGRSYFYNDSYVFGDMRVTGNMILPTGGNLNILNGGTATVDGTLSVNGGLHMRAGSTNFINSGGKLIALAQAENVAGTYTSLEGGTLTTGTWTGNGFGVSFPEIKTSVNEIMFSADADRRGQTGFSNGWDAVYMDSTRGARMRAQGGPMLISTTNANTLTLDSSSTIDVTAAGKATVTGGANGATLTSAGTTAIYGFGSAQMTTGSGGNITIAAGGNGAINLGASGTGVVASTRIMNTTASNAANVFINTTSGVMYRSTSSARYKTDIEPLVMPVDALLSVEPVRFRDKAEVARHQADPENEPTPKVHVGVIAEQLHDAGLGHFVNYMDDEPDSVSYDRMVIMAIPLFKQQQERIETLETQLAGMRAQIDALAA